MPIVFRVASVAGLVENGLLSLYSTRVASRGGNHWQHVLFVLACDTERCTGRETLNVHLNAADRKSCCRTERHSHSFPLNNIIAYLSQIIVNVHNDFNLGYKLCLEYFSIISISITCACNFNMALCRYFKMAIFKHDCWNVMVILNNKCPFVTLMKAVEELFLVLI